MSSPFAPKTCTQRLQSQCPSQCQSVQPPVVVPMAPKKATGPAPVVAKPAQKFYEAPVPKQERMYESPMKDGGKITRQKEFCLRRLVKNGLFRNVGATVIDVQTLIDTGASVRETG